jgi:5-methylcytosine-specific restriction enzyme A
MPKVGKKVDRSPRQTWYARAAWRRARRYQLHLEPLCQQCLKEGRVTPATQVDHVRPHGDNWDEFRTGQLQSLCRDCHWKKTMHEMGRRVRPRIGLDGFPIEYPAGDWREDDEDFEDEDLDQQGKGPFRTTA